ncbi:MAG: zinc-dependent alcohol dehydrogenase family protein [Candidatus Marinimicrobia bacterium]|nr:zinc-dependent alcohol dehydrogenase family protein [Candidatus Neomarinimicrobiota bacterium]
MRAISITGPGRIAMVDIPIPIPADHEVLIKVKASGICGTDVHIARGEYLGSYPVIPGHEFSGTIESMGSKVTNFREGDRVAIEPNVSCGYCEYCLNEKSNFCENWSAVGVTRPGGMAEYVCVPESTAFSIRDLAFEKAAFMEPLSCILHGVKKLDFSQAPQILIMGAGPIGLMFAQVCQFKGAKSVSMLEKQETRVELAKKMGGHKLYSDVSELPENSFDCIIDASGAMPLMESSISMVKKGGEILFFGVPEKGETLAIDAFTFFEKGLRLFTSYTSVKNSLEALDLLENVVVDVSALISHRLPLIDFERSIKMLSDKQMGTLKIMLNLEL